MIGTSGRRIGHDFAISGRFLAIIGSPCLLRGTCGVIIGRDRFCDRRAFHGVRYAMFRDRSREATVRTARRGRLFLNAMGPIGCAYGVWRPSDEQRAETGPRASYTQNRAVRRLYGSPCEIRRCQPYAIRKRIAEPEINIVAGSGIQSPVAVSSLDLSPGSPGGAQRWQVHLNT